MCKKKKKKTDSVLGKKSVLKKEFSLFAIILDTDLDVLTNQSYKSSSSA